MCEPGGSVAEDLFISYARADAAVVDALVGELRELGYRPFFDSDLTGGQRWWDTLLDRIESSDVFLPVISQHYLDSEACYQEATWAAGLGVPFLPIDVAQVDPQLCSRTIADANWVRYELEGRSSLARLSHALRTIPPRTPPAVAPTRPAIPMTYFGELEREIAGPLDWERQVVVIATLKSRLGTREDALARRLLRELQSNPRLSHASWREIEVALADDSRTNPPRADDPVAAPDVVPGAAPAATPDGVPDIGPHIGPDIGPDIGPVVLPEPRDAEPPSPSRRTPLVIGAVAAVAVAAAVVGFVVLGGGEDAKGDGAARIPSGSSDGGTPTDPTTSTPTLSAAEVLEASQPTGVWQFHDYTRTKTTRAGKTTDADPDDRPSKWTFTSNSCNDRVCRGEITTTRGTSYAYIWDGQQLKVPGWDSVDTEEWKACFDSSGNELPIGESSYRDTNHWTYGLFAGTTTRLVRPWTEKVTTEFGGSCSAQSDDIVKYEGVQIITHTGG